MISFSEIAQFPSPGEAPAVPKLHEVARRADVSVSTVSRVLNVPDKVSADTRSRVEQAIEELGYRPSRVARRLRVRRGRANMVGLIIPDIQNPFYSDIVRGVEDVAYHRDYAVILCNSDENQAREEFYLNVLVAESADGVILPPILGDEKTTARLSGLPLPVVCLDRRLSRLAVDTVVVDNRQGAYDAVTHLIRLGHRRIGLLDGPFMLSSFRERKEGYRAAHLDHGLPLDERLVASGEPRQEDGRRLAAELLALPEPPTALFAASNLITLGALEAIRDRGLEVPRQVAVVGFDDAPWAGLLACPLTTVSQPSYEMGRRAAQLMFDRLDEPARSPALVILAPTLVVRASCGATA
jgi:DNA-binding LacI/PurR family transcriptional regulator